MKLIFKIYIYKLNDFDSHPTSISFINVCSEESQIQFLIPVLKIIQKKNPKPSSYTNKYYQTYMYTLILYLYYSLVLSEQTNDLLDSKMVLYIIFKFWGSVKESKEIFKIIEKLYFNICISSDEEYYSQVRRYFFGMDQNDNNISL